MRHVSMKKTVITADFGNIERDVLFTMMYGKRPRNTGTLTHLLSKTKIPVYRTSRMYSWNETHSQLEAHHDRYDLEIIMKREENLKLGEKWLGHPFKLIQKVKSFSIRVLPSTGVIHIKQSFVQLEEAKGLMQEVIGGELLSVVFKVKVLDNFEVVKVANAHHKSLLK